MSDLLDQVCEVLGDAVLDSHEHLGDTTVLVAVPEPVHHLTKAGPYTVRL